MQPFADDRASLPAVDDQLARGAWLVVALLAFLYGVSLIDRIILALIAEPLRRDLGIGGFQFSLLFGASFVLVYSLSGIGAAYLADRGDRHRLLAAGVVIWCGTTFATGFATGFAVLLLLRGGVAIGESVLTPVAVSMIADLFPRERCTLPTSVYMMSGAVIGAAALVFGAGALALAQLAQAAVGLAPWRLTMMIVALPGFLGAIAFLVFAREPARRTDGTARAERTGFRELFAHLASLPGLYAGMFGGVAVIATTAYGLIAWGPTLLQRDFGLTVTRSGVFYGGASALGVVASMLIAPPLVSGIVRRRGVAGLIYAAGATALVGLPLVALAISSGSLAVTLFAIAVCAAAMATAAILPLNLIQLITPPRMQARTTALYLLMFGLAGQAIGPVLVNGFADHLFNGQPGALAYAIGVTAALSAITALGLCALALNASDTLPGRNGVPPVMPYRS